MKDIITHTIHNLLTEAVWGRTREATKRGIETYINDIINQNTQYKEK